MDRPPTLAELAAEPDFAGRMVAVAQQLAGAADEDDALEVLSVAAGIMGLDAAAFVSFVSSEESHESIRFLLACDPEWCSEYEQRASYASDPWLRHALTSSEPIRGHEIKPRTAQERELVELAALYGFRSALIVPAPSSGRLSRTGVLCLGSAREGYFDDDAYPAVKVVARSLAMELHAWWVQRLGQALVRDAKLTEEDLTLLAYERKGLCTKTMATMLGTSTQSINSRFQRMNARLGVPNRRAAGQMAAEYDLI